MKMKTIITIAILALSLSVFAGSKNKLKQIEGTVYENNNGKEIPLALAYVYLENSTICTYTNNDGTFSLDLPKGKHTLTIAFKGLNKIEKTITVAGDKEPLKLVLNSKNSQLADFNK